MATTISGDDNFDTASPSVTLLGTLATPTSGSSVTLSSVDLSGYSFLEVHVMGVSTNNNAAWIGLNGDTEKYTLGRQNTGAGVAGYGINLMCRVDLSTGIGFATLTGITTSTTFAASYTQYGGGHNYGITTSTTSLSIQVRSGYTFGSTAGTVKFYGVR